MYGSLPENVHTFRYKHRRSSLSQEAKEKIVRNRMSENQENHKCIPVLQHALNIMKLKQEQNSIDETDKFKRTRLHIASYTGNLLIA